MTRGCVQVAWNSSKKEEYEKLRKDEIEAKQREAVLAAHSARLEGQVTEMKTDMERLIAQQQELMAQVGVSPLRGLLLLLG
jgi:uncharacterized protein (DUF3084 family)